MGVLNPHHRSTTYLQELRDPAGLAEAYDMYAAPLYSYCRSLLREPADAADVVQDTFLIASTQLANLRNPERLRAWLYAVARNECLRMLKSRQAVSVFDQASDAADEASDVSGDAERAELRALLRGYLEPMLEAGADTLVLGCTHYPFLDAAIRDIVGERLALIDTSVAIARQLERVLEQHGLDLDQALRDVDAQPDYSLADHARDLAGALRWNAVGALRRRP